MASNEASLKFPLEKFSVLVQHCEMEEKAKIIFCLFISTSNALLFYYSLQEEKIPECLCLAARKMLSKSSTVQLGFWIPCWHQNKNISYQVPAVIGNKKVILLLRHSVIWRVNRLLLFLP